MVAEHDLFSRDTNEDPRAILAHLFATADEAIAANVDVMPAAVWVKADGTIGKAPLLAHGHLGAHQDAQLIRQQIVAPPHVPPGVPSTFEAVVAALPGSGGFLVLDCDVKGGKQGQQTLSNLVNQYGNFVTAAWRTPSGGVNVLLRKPAGAIYGNRSPWLGIDVRADGGWVVAPECSCAGGTWIWVVGGWGTASEIPPGMATMLSAPTLSGPQASKRATRDFIDASPTESTLPAMQKFSTELRDFQGAAAGSRHEALVHIVSWAFGMNALDLRDAMTRIKATWLALTVGEREREDEVDIVARWVVGQESAKRAAAPPPPGRSTSITRNLPDDFWYARPELRAIHDWAHSRMRSADAVYAAVRARVCALVPHTLTVDTGMAVPISLNSLLALIAKPGGGKTTSAALARTLVPIIRTDVYEGPLGSGEGVVELFFEWQDQPKPNSTGTIRVRVKTKTGALLLLDEGEALSRMAARSGTTILPTLRSAYSGELLGQTNASQDTKRILNPGEYRFVLLVGLQDVTAAGLLADVATGTPQRFVLWNANDPNIPDDAPLASPPWGGQGAWIPPTIKGQTMTVDPAVGKEIRLRALTTQRGTTEVEALDAHRDQNRVKEAAMLAILDKRLTVSVEDWRLAGMVMDTSDAVRQWVLNQSAAGQAKVAQARTASAATQAVAVAGALKQAALERGARAMAREARSKAPDRVSKGDLHDAAAGRDRKQASTNEMIERAVQSDWLRADGDGWIVGGSAPA